MKNSVHDNGGFIGRVADYTDTDYYTQTVTATDPHLSNVTLLIKFEGTDGGTTFTDSSPNNCTITGNNATTSTAVSKFGASSGYFGGSTSAYVYVSSADSGVSDFGTGDFTVEMFVYRTTSLGDKYFTNRQNVLSGPFLIMSTPTSPGNTLKINIGSTSYTTTNTIPTNQWSHIAVTRESGTVRAFIDGVLGVTGTNNTVSITDGTNNTRPPIIGGMGYAWGGATGNNHDGYIDELRVTKGVARYTANFTPPTASYGQAVVNANKKNTGVWSMDADYLNAELKLTIPTNGLIAHLDPANYTSGTTFADVSGNNNDMTLAGSPTHNTTNGGTFSFTTSQSMTTPNSGDMDRETLNYTVIYAAKINNTSSDRERVLQSVNNNWLLGFWDGIFDSYYAQAWVYRPSARDTNWRVFSATRDHSADQDIFYSNGVSLASNSSGSRGFRGLSVNNGAYSEASDCEVGILLVYDRVLTATEITQVYDMYKSRYGLT
jgi:hypothetical protein